MFQHKHNSFHWNAHQNRFFELIWIYCNLITYVEFKVSVFYVHSSCVALISSNSVSFSVISVLCIMIENKCTKRIIRGNLSVIFVYSFNVNKVCINHFFGEQKWKKRVKKSVSKKKMVRWTFHRFNFVC